MGGEVDLEHPLSLTKSFWDLIGLLLGREVQRKKNIQVGPGKAHGDLKNYYKGYWLEASKNNLLSKYNLEGTTF